MLKGAGVRDQLRWISALFTITWSYIQSQNKASSNLTVIKMGTSLVVPNAGFYPWSGN